MGGAGSATVYMAHGLMEIIFTSAGTKISGEKQGLHLQHHIWPGTHALGDWIMYNLRKAEAQNHDL